MKMFTTHLPLSAVETYKHSSSQETFLVLYDQRKSHFSQIASQYLKNSIFIGIGRLNHGHYSHVLIAPDGKVVIGTIANDLKEIA
jgi:hypothetical protein